MRVFEKFADAWLSCLGDVWTHGSDVTDDGVFLRERLNVSLSARTCDRRDFVAAGADERRIDLMLRKYTSLEPVEPYETSYGRLFRRHMDVNQIDWLIGRLRAKTHTKSATIGFHAPGSDALSCISLMDCKIRDGALSLTAVYRSQNILASQPGNVCALRDFQQEIAHAVAAGVGALTLHILSAHIYQHDWDATQELIGARQRSGMNVL
ncbi:thymidylate synthase [Streptomyces sp. NPDC046985]|uniref:thymidylate synthase n=1 Tax=Streptomyces sp. NPDC046985 TaxID=3155377 RepID=UPI0033EC3BD6